MNARRLPGMTLVELLVVVAILAVFFSLVMAIGQSDGTVKQAAQQFAAVLRKTQSKGLGTEIGAAVIIEGERSTSGEAEAEEVVHAYRATTVLDALMFPAITGVVESGPHPQGAYSTTADIVLLDADPAELRHGYKLRLFQGADSVDEAKDASQEAQPTSEWYTFRAMEGGAYQVAFRLAGGRSKFNAVWPRDTDGERRYMISRYPGRGGVAMDLPKRVAIDLRYSGLGDDPTTQWGALGGKGTIGVAFDMAGRVDTLMQQVLSNPDQQEVEPIDPAEPIYFLFVPRAEVADGVNTLALENAYWVVIQPPTGQVGVARNVPQQATTATALRAARENARKAIGLGK
jgi:prepilin-type N-terminal cleavage/methylation domain-containing protein